MTTSSISDVDEFVMFCDANLSLMATLSGNDVVDTELMSSFLHHQAKLYKSKKYAFDNATKP